MDILTACRIHVVDALHVTELDGVLIAKEKSTPARLVLLRGVILVLPQVNSLQSS